MSVKTISIIIPVLNEHATLVANLPHLQRWRHDGHELVVVDGGSTDQSLRACEGQVDHVLTAPAGRAAQMNAGAAVASGDVLLFLHIDTLLPAILPRQLIDLLAGSHGRCWGRFDVRLSSTRPVFRLIETLMNLRSGFTGVATGDQAIFVTREAFWQVGGFAPIPLMEDIQLSKSLKKVAGRPVWVRHKVVSSSRRWEKHGVVHTVLLMWQLRLAYFLGADPVALHARYYRPAALALEPADVRVLFFAKSPVAGRVKTRFIPLLGEQGALDLHKRLIVLTWQRISRGLAFPVELWLSESGYEDWFSRVCHIDGGQIASGNHIQRGQDLGQRMAHALTDALTRARYVLVVGADCASLDAAYLQQAAQALSGGAQVVVGPADDGGYVLLGVSGHVPDGIFDGVQWGTDQVFAQTRSRLTAAALNWVQLPMRWDVDRPEDLPRLAALES